MYAQDAMLYFTHQVIKTRRVDNKTFDVALVVNYATKANNKETQTAKMAY